MDRTDPFAEGAFKRAWRDAEDWPGSGRLLAALWLLGAGTFGAAHASSLHHDPGALLQVAGAVLAFLAALGVLVLLRLMVTLRLQRNEAREALGKAQAALDDEGSRDAVLRRLSIRLREAELLLGRVEKQDPPLPQGEWSGRFNHVNDLVASDLILYADEFVHYWEQDAPGEQTMQSRSAFQVEQLRHIISELSK